MKVLLLLLFLSLSGKEPSENRIPYRILSFNDFRGKVPAQESLVAGRTTVQTLFGFTEADGVYRYDVKAFFLPDSSFLRIRTWEVLIHERTHFKIAYIASLRCLRELAPLQEGDSSSLDKAEAIYKRYNTERDALNEKFDQETNHGLENDKEEYWEVHVDQELRKLEKEARRKPE